MFPRTVVTTLLIGSRFKVRSLGSLNVKRTSYVVRRLGSKIRRHVFMTVHSPVLVTGRIGLNTVLSMISSFLLAVPYDLILNISESGPFGC